MEVKPGIPAVSVDEELLKELAGEVGEGDTVTVKLTVSSSSSSGSSQPILPFVDVKRTDEWYQAIWIPKPLWSIRYVRPGYIQRVKPSKGAGADILLMCIQAWWTEILLSNR